MAIHVGEITLAAVIVAAIMLLFNFVIIRECGSPQLWTTMPTEEVVLVTGGAGFVGSHTVYEMLAANYSVVVVDNLVNAARGDRKPASLQRVEKLAGRTVHFHEVDLLDRPALSRVFQSYRVKSVIHFAALKAVGESVRKPLAYYKNNIIGTITLMEVMRENGVFELVFSSSATVYGTPQYLPVDEQHPTGMAITNPYGRTKYFIEEIFKDQCRADQSWRITLLRYFNPVGAHESGDIGEDPSGQPNNLMPYVAQVAVGRRPVLSVFGHNYSTTDGTGVRDYIHVVDLARGHLAALTRTQSGCSVYNLGTGRGYSVLEVVDAFRRASGQPIPYKLVERREGDVAAVYADCSKAERELGWRAKKTLDEMCASSWQWQLKNKYGYAEAPPEDI